MNNYVEEQFTRFPSVFMEIFRKDPYGFVFAFSIYRWTIGFQRKSFKLSNIKLSEETGISESKIGKIRERACKKAGINATKLPGGYEYEITIFPQRKESLSPGKRKVSFKERVDFPREKVSRGAIDNTIDNIIDKDRYLFFKSKYPEVKWNEPISEWKSLTDQDRIDVCEVMEFQNNLWNQLDNAQFVPKASNYLLKTEFKDEKVYGPLKDKRRREQERIKQQKYFEKAEENAASDEERREMLQLVNPDKTGGKGGLGD